MHPLATGGVSSKRNRHSDRINRRFSVKAMKKKEIIPLASAQMPRKVKNARRSQRLMGVVALFFIILSTGAAWRKRSMLRRHALTIPKPSSSQIASKNSAPSPVVAESDHHKELSVAHTDHSTDFEPAVYNNSSTASAAQAQEPPSAPKHDTQSAAHEEEHSSAATSGHMASSEKETETEKEDTELKKEDEGKDEDSLTDETAKHNSAPASSNTQQQAESHGDHEDSYPVRKSTVVEPVDNGADEVVTFEELPERIEWYTRDDFKDGSRPLCRISRPIILSNGTILLPSWMETHSRLLERCAIGKISFYSADEVPTFLQQSNSIDVDFALTIHLSRFQEPTHDASIYLTEHVLKASYLFDVFSGHIPEAEAVHEEHCYMYSNGSSHCDLNRPPKSALKAGLLVPRRIELASRETWSYKMVEMFGKAHGHGHGVVHLNTSSLLAAKHSGKSEKLIGTRFRSMMTMDGMFRHLPVEALKFGKFFSRRNEIVKTARTFVNHGKCELTIGIACSEAGVFKSGVELQGRLKVLTKFAIPESSIDVNLIDVHSSSVREIAKQIQQVDILLGASGHDLNVMGFMRSSGTVFELMPFGIRPSTYESLSRALGLGYERVRGKPQSDFFKKCIDSEVFSLKKHGRVKFTDKPEWYAPLMKAWDEAVREFATAGSSSLDVLSAEGTMKNYHSRVCAQRQMVEVGLDDTARQVIMAAKAKCGLK